MKKLIIAIIALLLVGGASFGAYTFVNKPAEATETKEIAKAATAAEVKPPSYVELKPLVLPVLDRDGVSQIISIVISLEVENPEMAAKAEALKPRLTDAYIQAMY